MQLKNYIIFSSHDVLTKYVKDRLFIEIFFIVPSDGAMNYIYRNIFLKYM